MVRKNFLTYLAEDLKISSFEADKPFTENPFICEIESTSHMEGRRQEKSIECECKQEKLVSTFDLYSSNSELTDKINLDLCNIQSKTSSEYYSGILDIGPLKSPSKVDSLKENFYLKEQSNLTSSLEQISNDSFKSCISSNNYDWQRDPQIQTKSKQELSNDSCTIKSESNENFGKIKSLIDKVIDISNMHILQTENENETEYFQCLSDEKKPIKSKIKNNSTIPLDTPSQYKKNFVNPKCDESYIYKPEKICSNPFVSERSKSELDVKFLNIIKGFNTDKNSQNELEKNFLLELEIVFFNMISDLSLQLVQYKNSDLALSKFSRKYKENFFNELFYKVAEYFITSKNILPNSEIETTVIYKQMFDHYNNSTSEYAFQIETKKQINNENSCQMYQPNWYTLRRSSSNIF